MTKRFKKPDNWHAHLRTGSLMATIIHHFGIYGRVMCMGNTDPPIDTGGKALHYRKQILSHEVEFEPAMCIMLTENTTPETIYNAAKLGIRFVKFIPQGTSYGATEGVRLWDYKKLFPIFRAMQECGIHLLIHAELMCLPGGREIALPLREGLAVPCVAKYRRYFPNLLITIEHGSTSRMIDFVKRDESGMTAMTLSPQHGFLTYEDVLRDGIEFGANPHNLCYPIAKTENDRKVVVKAMISGDERFLAGTDAAPHWFLDKICEDPKPGIFFGENEYLRYLEIFEEAGASDKIFEDFTSRFGAERYGFPLNAGTITVKQETWTPVLCENGIRYCLGDKPLRWQFVR